MPQIEVTFDIDANGILHVSAKDLGTGKEQKITITASSGLSKDEIEKMRKDAEAHAEEDRKGREEIETRNEADNAVYRSEKFLKENGDKISGGGKEQDGIGHHRGQRSPQGRRRLGHPLGRREAQRGLAGRLGRVVQGGGGKGPRGARPGPIRPRRRPPAAGGAAKGGGKKDEGPIIDAEVVDEKKS